MVAILTDKCVAEQLFGACNDLETIGRGEQNNDGVDNVECSLCVELGTKHRFSKILKLLFQATSLLVFF